MNYNAETLHALWKKHAENARFCDEMYNKCTQKEKLQWINLASEEHEKCNHYLELWLKRTAKDFERRKKAA